MDNEEKDIEKVSAPEGEFEKKYAEETSVGKVKKGNKRLTLVIIGVVVVSLIFFTQTDEGKNILTKLDVDQTSTSKKVKYANPISKYSFEYIPNENAWLVSADNIPVELEAEGYRSMQDFKLADSDALLIRSDIISENNIVYTVREIPERKGYPTLEEYLKIFRVDLENTMAISNTEYVEKESSVGKDKLSAVEFSFEIEVSVGKENAEKTLWLFYNTIFEMKDVAYSISFGYPKDIENAQFYIDSYSDIIDSFTYDEGVPVKVDSILEDSENTEEETETEEGEIELEVIE